MVEASIQHIVGTVALIGLVISSGLSYAVFTSYIQGSNRENELGQISETVALNLVEMINLVKFSKYSSEYIIKIIDLPTDISGRTYKIQLVDDTKLGVHVHTFLATEQAVGADSTIPRNSGDICLRFNTTETIYKINVGVENRTIACSGTVYGKNGFVVWASLDWDYATGLPSSITIGIGWAESQQ